MSGAARRSRGGGSASLRAAMSVLSLLAGCAGDAAGTGRDEPDGASAGPQETEPPGVGGGAEGSGGAGGEAPPEPTRTGHVLLGRGSHYDMDDAGLADAALFAELEAEPRPPSSTEVACDEVVVAACTYTRCEVVVPSTSDPVPTTFTSAGTLTVGGDATPLTASPREDFTYEQPWPLDGALLGVDEPWPSAGTVTIDASGGEVPAFTASVRAPTRYLLDASTYPIRTVDRSEDLVLTWTALGDGDSTVFLDIELPGGEGIGETIECEVPVVDEQLVVPRELLARLPPAARDDEDGPIMWIGSYERTWVTAGDWNVSVAVADYPWPHSVAIE